MVINNNIINTNRNNINNNINIKYNNNYIIIMTRHIIAMATMCSISIHSSFCDKCCAKWKLYDFLLGLSIFNSNHGPFQDTAHF